MPETTPDTSWNAAMRNTILITLIEFSRSRDKGILPATGGRKVPGLILQTAELPNVNGIADRKAKEPDANCRDRRNASNLRRLLLRL